MKGKKSFVLYCDLIHTVEKLSDEDAGILLKHLLKYVNDLDPEPPNLLVDIAFEGIKQGLKRDLQKWKHRVEVNRENGSKGGRPKNPKEPKKTDGLNSKPKKPDNDSDIDNVIDNVIDNTFKKSKQKNATLDLNEIFESNDLSNKFMDWIEYRKQIRKSMKESTMNSQIKFLKKYSADVAIQIIEQSIRNGWTGVFPLKEKVNNQDGASNFDKMCQTVEDAKQIIRNQNGK